MSLAIDLRPLLDEQPGGVGSYTVSLLAALRELPDLKLTPIITGRTAGLFTDEELKGVKRVRFPNPLLNASIRFLSWPKLDRLARAERYLLPNWNFLALDKKTEFILVVHDLSFERNPGWFSPKQRLWHRAVRPRALVKRANRIIAVSEWTKHDLVELYGVPETKVSVVYPVPDRPPEELPFPVSLPERYILFLGAVEERKNPLALVRAFERIADQHKEAQLIIAGKHGWGSGKVIRAAKASPVHDRIRVMGYVPTPVRHALYRKATVFAYPSFYEGFGIPVVEAMHAGVPVVVGNRSAMPEVVQDAGVLVDPLDVSALATALDEILVSDSLARDLSRRGLARAADFPDSMAPALGKILR